MGLIPRYTSTLSTHSMYAFYECCNPENEKRDGKTPWWSCSRSPNHGPVRAHFFCVHSPFAFALLTKLCKESLVFPAFYRLLSLLNYSLFAENSPRPHMAFSNKASSSPLERGKVHSVRSLPGESHAKGNPKVPGVTDDQRRRPATSAKFGGEQFYEHRSGRGGKLFAVFGVRRGSVCRLLFFLSLSITIRPTDFMPCIYDRWWQHCAATGDMRRSHVSSYFIKTTTLLYSSRKCDQTWIDLTSCYKFHE